MKLTLAAVAALPTLVLAQSPLPPPFPPPFPPPPEPPPFPPPIGTLTVGPEVVPFSNLGTSATYFTDTAKMDGYAAITCYTSVGIRCQLVVRERQDQAYHGDEPYGDSRDAHTTLSAPVSSLGVWHEGRTPLWPNMAWGNHIQVTSDANAIRSSITSLDQRNAIVCYSSRIGAGYVHCKALKLYGRLIIAGPELVVASLVTLQTSLAAFDPRGAPIGWAARRALLCYNHFTTANRELLCRTLSLTFPNVPGTNRENGNIAGTLVANTPTIIENTPTGTVHPNYPGARLYPAKALATFDYFNAIICYTMPMAMAYNPQCNFGVTSQRYYYGVGQCRALSTDDATGTTVTLSAGSTTSGAYPVHGTNLITDLTVEAFRSKSGDPTRALVCYTTLTAADTNGAVDSRYSATSGGLYCNVVQRVNDGLTFLNSERTAAGAASAGVDKTIRIAVSQDAINVNGFVNGVTIAALDEYNFLICYTNSRSAQCPPNQVCAVRQCPYPPTGGCGGLVCTGSGLNNGHGNGAPTCRALWIEGWGSSTYNSNVFSGIAAASAPVNVGSVTNIRLGDPFTISAAVGMYPSIVSFKPDYSVLCFSKTAVPAAAPATACHLITDQHVAQRVWQFNNPVDCVNGYGCTGLLNPVGRRLNTAPNATAPKATAPNATAKAEAEAAPAGGD